MTRTERWFTGSVFALAILGLATGPAGAATVVITLDAVSETACGVPWFENGCEMWFAQTTDEDEYPGYCLVNPHVEQGGNAGVYIWPARLVVQLANVQDLQSVEVDVYETHFAGSTRAFLYAGGAQVDYAESTQELTQTLVLEAGGAVPDLFAVSAHESAVWEIRLIGDTLVPAEERTFSAIKSMYR